MKKFFKIIINKVLGKIKKKEIIKESALKLYNLYKEKLSNNIFKFKKADKNQLINKIKFYQIKEYIYLSNYWEKRIDDLLISVRMKSLSDGLMKYLIMFSSAIYRLKTISFIFIDFIKLLKICENAVKRIFNNLMKAIVFVKAVNSKSVEYYLAHIIKKYMTYLADFIRLKVYTYDRLQDWQKIKFSIIFNVLKLIKNVKNYVIYFFRNKIFFGELKKFTSKIYELWVQFKYGKSVGGNLGGLSQFVNFPDEERGVTPEDGVRAFRSLAILDRSNLEPFLGLPLVHYGHQGKIFMNTAKIKKRLPRKYNKKRVVLNLKKKRLLVNRYKWSNNNYTTIDDFFFNRLNYIDSDFGAQPFQDYRKDFQYDSFIKKNENIDLTKQFFRASLLGVKLGTEKISTSWMYMYYLIRKKKINLNRDSNNGSGLISIYKTILERENKRQPFHKIFNLLGIITAHKNNFYINRLLDYKRINRTINPLKFSLTSNKNNSFTYNKSNISFLIKRPGYASEEENILRIKYGIRNKAWIVRHRFGRVSSWGAERAAQKANSQFLGKAGRFLFEGLGYNPRSLITYANAKPLFPINNHAHYDNITNKEILLNIDSQVITNINHIKTYNYDSIFLMNLLKRGSIIRTLYDNKNGGLLQKTISNSYTKSIFGDSFYNYYTALQKDHNRSPFWDEHIYGQNYKNSNFNGLLVPKYNWAVNKFFYFISAAPYESTHRLYIGSNFKQYNWMQDHAKELLQKSSSLRLYLFDAEIMNDFRELNSVDFLGAIGHRGLLSVFPIFLEFDLEDEDVIDDEEEPDQDEEETGLEEYGMSIPAFMYFLSTIPAYFEDMLFEIDKHGRLNIKMYDIYELYKGFERNLNRYLLRIMGPYDDDKFADWDPYGNANIYLEEKEREWRYTLLTEHSRVFNIINWWAIILLFKKTKQIITIFTIQLYQMGWYTVNSIQKAYFINKRYYVISNKLKKVVDSIGISLSLILLAIIYFFIKEVLLFNINVQVILLSFMFFMFFLAPIVYLVRKKWLMLNPEYEFFDDSSLLRAPISLFGLYTFFLIYLLIPTTLLATSVWPYSLFLFWSTNNKFDNFYDFLYALPTNRPLNNGIIYLTSQNSVQEKWSRWLWTMDPNNYFEEYNRYLPYKTDEKKNQLNALFELTNHLTSNSDIKLYTPYYYNLISYKASDILLNTSHTIEKFGIIAPSQIIKPKVATTPGSPPPVGFMILNEKIKIVLKSFQNWYTSKIKFYLDYYKPNFKPWIPKRHPINLTQREIIEYNKKLSFWDWGQILRNDLPLYSSDLYRSSAISFFKSNNIIATPLYLRYGATIDSEKLVLPKFNIKLYSYNKGKNMEYFKDIQLSTIAKKNNLTRNDLIFHYNLYDKIGRNNFSKINREQLIGLNPINYYTQPTETWLLHQFRPSYSLRTAWAVDLKVPKGHMKSLHNFFGQIVHKKTPSFIPRTRKNKRDRLILTTIRQEAPDNYYFKRALTRFYSMKHTREDSNLYIYQHNPFFRISFESKEKHVKPSHLASPNDFYWDEYISFNSQGPIISKRGFNHFFLPNYPREATINKKFLINFFFRWVNLRESLLIKSENRLNEKIGFTNFLNLSPIFINESKILSDNYKESSVARLKYFNFSYIKEEFRNRTAVFPFSTLYKGELHNYEQGAFNNKDVGGLSYLKRQHYAEPKYLGNKEIYLAELSKLFPDKNFKHKKFYPANNSYYEINFHKRVHAYITVKGNFFRKVDSSKSKAEKGKFMMELIKEKTPFMQTSYSTDVDTDINLKPLTNYVLNLKDKTAHYKLWVGFLLNKSIQSGNGIGALPPQEYSLIPEAMEAPWFPNRYMRAPKSNFNKVYYGGKDEQEMNYLLDRFRRKEYLANLDWSSHLNNPLYKFPSQIGLEGRLLRWRVGDYFIVSQILGLLEFQNWDSGLIKLIYRIKYNFFPMLDIFNNFIIWLSLKLPPNFFTMMEPDFVFAFYQLI